VFTFRSEPNYWGKGDVWPAGLVASDSWCVREGANIARDGALAEPAIRQLSRPGTATGRSHISASKPPIVGRRSWPRLAVHCPNTPTRITAHSARRGQNRPSGEVATRYYAGCHACAGMLRCRSREDDGMEPSVLLVLGLCLLGLLAVR